MRLPSPPFISRTILLAGIGIAVLAIIAVWFVLQLPSEKEKLSLYLPANETSFLLTTSKRETILQWLRNAQGVFTDQLLPEASLEQAAVYDLALIRSETGSLAGWAVETRSQDAKTGKTLFKIITSDARIRELLKQTREGKRQRLADLPIMRPILDDAVTTLYVRISAIPQHDTSDSTRLLRALLAPYDTIVIEADNVSGAVRLKRQASLTGSLPASLGETLPAALLPSPTFAIAVSEPQRIFTMIIDQIRKTDPSFADGFLGIVQQQWTDRFPLLNSSGAMALFTKPLQLAIQENGTFILRGETDASTDSTQALKSLLASGSAPYVIRRQQFSPQHNRTDIMVNNVSGRTVHTDGWTIEIAAGSGAAIARRNQQFIFSNSGSLVLHITNTSSQSSTALPQAISQNGIIAVGTADLAFVNTKIQAMMPFLLPLPDWFMLVQSTLLPQKAIQWSLEKENDVSIVRWMDVRQ